MKKLLIVFLLIPLCVMSLPKNEADYILEDISDYIVDNMKHIENTENLYTDSDFWTPVTWIWNYKSYSWTYDYDKNVTYIFYAATNNDKVKVKVCFNGVCSKPGRYTKLRFKPKVSGEQRIWIRGVNDEAALTVGYHTHLTKEYINMPWHNR